MLSSTCVFCFGADAAVIALHALRVGCDDTHTGHAALRQRVSRLNQQSQAFTSRCTCSIGACCFEYPSGQTFAGLRRDGGRGSDVGLAKYEYVGRILLVDCHLRSAQLRMHILLFGVVWTHKMCSARLRVLQLQLVAHHESRVRVERAVW